MNSVVKRNATDTFGMQNNHCFCQGVSRARAYVFVCKTAHEPPWKSRMMETLALAAQKLASTCGPQSPCGSSMSYSEGLTQLYPVSKDLTLYKITAVPNH